jgi:alpha-beta hydrolase superfamily lysophospholipase
MSKPTVVIVPGVWQKPVVWDAFRVTLEKAGYPSSVHVALPTTGGTETPLAGLAEDVAVVRGVLEPLVDQQGREVVLLCHSSGGVIGSNAVEGFDLASRKAAGKTGGVIRVVFLSAFMLPKGQSLLALLGGNPLPWMKVEVKSRISSVLCLSPFADVFPG